jgi:hypothetical protein
MSLLERSSSGAWYSRKLYAILPRFCHSVATLAHDTPIQTGERKHTRFLSSIRHGFRIMSLHEKMVLFFSVSTPKDSPCFIIPSHPSHRLLQILTSLASCLSMFSESKGPRNLVLRVYTGVCVCVVCVYILRRLRDLVC